MSDNASMVLMSSPSLCATSVGEPDCDEPPEPPNGKTDLKSTLVSLLTTESVLASFTISNTNTGHSNNINIINITSNNNDNNNNNNNKKNNNNNNDDNKSQCSDNDSDAMMMRSMISTDDLLSLPISPLDTSSDSNAPLNVRAYRRASNSSISDDDTNSSVSSHPGSLSPISFIQPATTIISLSAPSIIGGEAAHGRHAPAMMAPHINKDIYESKEMTVARDPRHVVIPHDIEMKDSSMSSSMVSLPLLSLSHKSCGEEEHKEETTAAPFEFKDANEVDANGARKEEKKVIVMLATAMLADDGSHTADKQIAFNLGKLEMVADLSHTLEGLGHSVRYELVSHQNVDDIVAHIKPTDLVFNLCDGTDDDGVIGVSLVNKLETKRLAFTGACSNFYTISSAKSRMKECFEGARVPTMPYRVVEENEDPAVALADGPMSLSGHLAQLKQWPLFVKPDDAYGSMGISDACVCRNQAELMAQCAAMRASGFKRLMVEGFLDGDEFSVLMTDVQTYPAVKKVYLREGALCLDFKADWIDNSYEMIPVPDQELDDRLRAVSQSAYASVAGNSYARVDLRIHRATGIICVLEVNSQPGIGDNSTAWDVLVGYAQTAKLSKAHVTAQFLQDIISHPRRGLLPLGTTVDNVPHADPE